MHIDVTPETLLIQLGYPRSDALLAQMERTIAATDGFETFAHHLLTLKDAIARYEGYIALSNSRDALKIKSDAVQPDEIEAYRQALVHWSDKYKVALEPVGTTATYYILGRS